MSKMSKASKARQERALINGSRYFNGDPCIKRGSVVRYAKVNKCVACRAANHKAKWRSCIEQKELPVAEIVEKHKSNPIYQAW